MVLSTQHHAMTKKKTFDRSKLTGLCRSWRCMTAYPRGLGLRISQRSTCSRSLRRKNNRNNIACITKHKSVKCGIVYESFKTPFVYIERTVQSLKDFLIVLHRLNDHRNCFKLKIKATKS